MHAYRTTYNVLQTPTQNNACHIGQDTMSFRYHTEQRMSCRTSYDVLQTLTQNNAYHIGQATMSFRHQHGTMHVISDKLQCPSDTNTEQCISYRTSYDVLQTPTQNNACHFGPATMSFRH